MWEVSVWSEWSNWKYAGNCVTGTVHGESSAVLGCFGFVCEVAEASCLSAVVVLCNVSS